MSMKKQVILIAALGMTLLCFVIFLHFSLAHARPAHEPAASRPGESLGEAVYSNNTAAALTPVCIDPFPARPGSWAGRP
jgi:hypothetical protein